MIGFSAVDLYPSRVNRPSPATSIIHEPGKGIGEEVGPAVRATTLSKMTFPAKTLLKFMSKVTELTASNPGVKTVPRKPFEGVNKDCPSDPKTVIIGLIAGFRSFTG